MAKHRPKRGGDTTTPERRTDAEIVDELLVELDPPPDQREAIRAKVIRRIKYMRLKADRVREIAPERFRSAQKRKKELGDYLKALWAAARKYRALPRRHYDSDEQKMFRELLYQEILRIEMHHRDIKVGHGHKPRDLSAKQAAESALGLLCPRWWETPREEWPKITREGAWHLLSTLLYEALSSQSDRDHVLNYMARLKRQGLRLDEDELERRADPDLYPRWHHHESLRKYEHIIRRRLSKMRDAAA
jgi:hypothetical protein